ncbi:hypothetical protein ABZX75_00245 [Streptomyces sp. NPDC003038]|uniref:hypothetical protein n=1 Tax=unclassified Streptomyces TaxID=2593676 RepID=UPI00339F63B2
MGGWEHTQRGRRGRRTLRHAVLPALLGVLVGALFLCARPGEAHDSAPVSWQDERAVCVSPYEVPGCSPLTHVTPAVLPVPPPAVTPAGGAPPSPAAAGPAGRVRQPGPLARAPDPYALQVLRT